MLSQEVAKIYANALLLSVVEKGMIDVAYDQFKSLKELIAKDKSLVKGRAAPQDLDETLSKYDTLNFQIDGTEGRRQRPKDPKKQKEFYSGKKKHIHTKIML